MSRKKVNISIFQKMEIYKKKKKKIRETDM